MSSPPNPGDRSRRTSSDRPERRRAPVPRTRYSPGRPDKRWSYFIRKVYETDPLICPKCQGKMRITSFIDQPDVIKKILQHLGLWEGYQAPPERDSPIKEITFDFILRFDKLTVPRKIERQPGDIKSLTAIGSPAVPG